MLDSAKAQRNTISAAFGAKRSTSSNGSRDTPTSLVRFTKAGNSSTLTRM